jgi:hypothetical protein
MLRFDSRSRRYIGTRLLVSEGAYLAACRALLAQGYGAYEALRALRDEARWSLDDAGVEPYLQVTAVLTEAAVILRETGQRGRGDVVGAPGVQSNCPGPAA